MEEQECHIHRKNLETGSHSGPFGDRGFYVTWQLKNFPHFVCVRRERDIYTLTGVLSICEINSGELPRKDKATLRLMRAVPSASLSVALPYHRYWKEALSIKEKSLDVLFSVPGTNWEQSQRVFEGGRCWSLEQPHFHLGPSEKTRLRRMCFSR